MGFDGLDHHSVDPYFPKYHSQYRTWSHDQSAVTHSKVRQGCTHPSVKQSVSLQSVLSQSSACQGVPIMDILQVQGPQQNIEPSLAIEEGACTLVEEWIQMALNIEEKQ